MQTEASHSSQDFAGKLGGIAKRGDIVAIVGAGGKTTTMFALAQALARRGLRVVTSKSTAIHAPSMSRSPKLVISKPEHWHDELPATVAHNPVITVVTSAPSKRRFEGIAPELAPSLLNASGADVLIVEADGARRRSLKIPGSHEPSMPHGATVVLPVASFSAAGAPLSAHVVHRPELAGPLLGLRPGAILSPRHVVAVVVHEEAGLKSIPPNAKVWPVLTATSCISQAELHRARKTLKDNSRITGWIEASTAWAFTVRQ